MRDKEKCLKKPWVKVQRWENAEIRTGDWIQVMDFQTIILVSGKRSFAEIVKPRIQKDIGGIGWGLC